MKTEEQKPSNPSAFPLDANVYLEEYKGMTLRDYFANSAMQAFLGADFQMEKINGDIESNDKIISLTAYRIADAMLKQREL